jgi:competence protein ComEC
MHPALLYHWHRAPFLRIIIPFMAGISAQWYWQLKAALFLFFIGIGLVGLLSFSFWPHRFRFSFPVVPLLCSGILLLGLGGFLCFNKDVRSYTHWLGYSLKDSANETVEVVVTEEAVEKNRSYKVISEAIVLHRASKEQQVKGGVLLYLQKEASAAKLKPGDRLLLLKSPQRIRNNGNPGELDFARAMLFNRITHSNYYRSNEYTILPTTRGDYAMTRKISELRHFILERLDRHFSNKQAAGLAAALLIGYRNDLDPELAAAYSNTGVIHVIAISGLHLALLGWLLNKLLSPLKKTKAGLLVAQVILLGVLWVFSLLAEATPSVLRAVILFSVLGASELLNRQGNSMNTLAAAAFLLLCYNPFWLWDLGFQLSFAAVLSILIFGKRLSETFTHSNYFIHQAGQLIAISLAAQLLTTPFTLFYFHQFPGSFLLSNLVAVPLSSVILGAALLTCLLVSVPVAGPWTAKATEWMITIMNNYVTWVETIPGLLWKDLYWSWSESVLLLFLLLALGHWLLNRATTGRIASLVFSLSLLVFQVNATINASPQKVIIYHHKKYTVIEFIKDRQSQLLMDSTAFEDSTLQKYLLTPSHQALGVRISKKKTLPVSFLIDAWQIVSPHKRYNPSAISNDTINLLVLNRNSPYDPGPWIHKKKIHQAVFTATLGSGTKERWRAILDSAQVSVHDIITQGAFVYSPR